VHLRGAANSGAIRFPAGGSGFGFVFPAAFLPLNQFVITSYGNADWLATVRGRVGVAHDNWLYYVTGGLAFTQMNGDLLFTDGVAGIGAGAIQSARIDNVFKIGHAVGGGVEAGLTDRLSVKAEYLYVKFANQLAGETSNNIPSFTGGLFQSFKQSQDLTANIVRAGFNYKLNGSGADAGSGTIMPMPQLKAPAWSAPTAGASNWEIEVGPRTWFSTGTIGAPALVFPQVLVSRLTYNDLNAVAGETFARADHASGLFVKGFLGAGRIYTGHLHDEDFPNDLAYSNTLSSASGSLAYANVDLGYTLLRAPGARLGVFAGYNYFTQHVNTYGCQQLAGDDSCAPGGIAPQFLVIAEQERYDTLRVGVAEQFMLTDRLRFAAEAAYVPWTSITAEDNHNARELVFPARSNGGNGVMLEAMLDYELTKHLNIGVGGRYWAWNMRTGRDTVDNLGLPGPHIEEPQLFANERYGAFVQTSYHWDDDKPAAGAGALMPVMTPVAAQRPMNWTGIYVGAQLGGGWSDAHWSDPFGTAPSGFGLLNFAGFGDTVHGSGPLAGGQVGANWQVGQWVLGVQGDTAWADVRGENTCFSGLGGINCQRVDRRLSTVTGRLGFAFDRALVYAKGGGAFAGSIYNLNGNTFNVTLGVGSTRASPSGAVVGGGLEYAFTDNWTALFEYDHFEFGSMTVPFPTVMLVNAQSIGIRQTLDTIKVGLNYKAY
jgi:opacity protein-like surface antigen